MKAYVKEYRRLRAIGWNAQQSLRAAKTLVEWDASDGYESHLLPYSHIDYPPYESGSGFGPIRLRIEPDDSPYDDSFIDTWNDNVTIMLDGRQLDNVEYRKDLWNRIEFDGVWGIIGEFWNGQEWEHADSCWGFIGDDWKDSGYDTDIMQETLAALAAWNRYLETMARETESTRLDMYQGVEV